MNADYDHAAAVEASARIGPMLRELTEVRHLPADDPRRIAAIEEKHAVLALIAEAEKPTPTMGEQLDVIGRRLDETTQAWAAAGHPLSGPEVDAREAAFAALRDWNERMRARR